MKSIRTMEHAPGAVELGCASGPAPALSSPWCTACSAILTLPRVLVRAQGGSRSGMSELRHLVGGGDGHGGCCPWLGLEAYGASGRWPVRGGLLVGASLLSTPPSTERLPAQRVKIDLEYLPIFLGYVLIINMSRIIFIGRTDTFTSDIFEIL